jgi:hypothetical protein
MPAAGSGGGSSAPTQVARRGPASPPGPNRLLVLAAAQGLTRAAPPPHTPTHQSSVCPLVTLNTSGRLPRVVSAGGVPGSIFTANRTLLRYPLSRLNSRTFESRVTAQFTQLQGSPLLNSRVFQVPSRKSAVSVA